MVKCYDCQRTFHLNCLPLNEYNDYIKNKQYICTECQFRINQIIQVNQGIYNNLNNNNFNLFNNNLNNTNNNHIIIQDKEKNLDNNNKILNLIPINFLMNINQNQNIQNNYRNNNNEFNNLQYLLESVLNNKYMTNEERLNYILKNNKNFPLSPIIMKVLRDRENYRKNIENQNNNYNIINENKQENNFLNSFDNIFNKKKIINNSYSEENNNINLNNKENNINSVNNQNKQNFFPNNKSNFNQQLNQNNNQNGNSLNINFIQNQKFPIDDKILFNNLDKFDISKDILIRPKGEIINIPFHTCNKLIIIWDFLYTFEDCIFTEKSFNYIIPNNFEEFNKDFYENDFFEKLLILFLLLFTNNLKLLDVSSNDKNIFIIKNLYENIHSSPFNIFYECKNIILYLLCIFPIYHNLCQKETLKIIENLYLKNNFNEINNNNKIDLIYNLIAIAYDTKIIKDKITEEIEKNFNLSYEKMNLEESLKENEKKKKEINKNNFEELKLKLDELNNNLKEINEKLGINENKKEEEEKKIENDKENSQTKNNEEENKNNEEENNNNNILNNFNDKNEQQNNNKNQNKIELNNEEKQKLIDEKKEKENKKIKIESLFKENEFLDEKKNELILKINNNKEQIKQLKIPRKKLLGMDYQKNEYFYFNLSPNNLYIKNKKEKNWSVIKETNKIKELINKLCEKGIKEKKLKIRLNRILSEIENNNENLFENNIIIKNPEKKETEKNEEENEDIKNLNENSIKTISINNSINNSQEIISIEPQKIYTINEILIEMELKFSEYLKQYDKEWESEENRKLWKEIISITNDDNNFYETLKMFNYRFKNPYKIFNEDEMEEINNENYVISKDTNKYIFKEGKKNLVIYETVPNKILSPKVKIWTKEVEQYEIDKYYTNVLLKNNKFNHQQLLYMVHFYENVIFGLIKRRENKKKSLL